LFPLPLNNFLRITRVSRIRSYPWVSFIAFSNSGSILTKYGSRLLYNAWASCARVCMTAILTLRFLDFNYLTSPSTIKGKNELNESVDDLVLSREG